MRKAARRLATATATLVAAGALPILAAAPAQATTKQCETFLAGAGYKVGPKVHNNCAIGSGSLQNYGACLTGLLSLKIRYDLADIACQQAGRFH
ncbi:hypothetical protein [Streptomyces lydicus]|uniref:hypothetical protein n=1 Tax=Streptomyces lydicus TaxID=47763 RepID=UPI00286FEB5F|nr:hypothetical protein [Streptomyces lydicus]